MGKFLDILEEIEACRTAGFGRPALFEALMLPDICGESMRTRNKAGRNKYVKWIQKYVSLTYPCAERRADGKLYENKTGESKNISLSAREIYSLRNCLFHGGNVRCFKDRNPAPYVFVFSQVDCKFPGVISLNSVYGYKEIEIGMLISQLVNGAKKYYQEADNETKAFLDSFDELVVYKDFLSEMIPKMTPNYLNGRNYKHTARDN